ncbi:MAG: S8 family serine peptidase, partial [Fibrobacterales bacterium]
MKLKQSIAKALSVPLLMSVGIGAATLSPSSLSYSLDPQDTPADRTAVLSNTSSAPISWSVKAIRLTQTPNIQAFSAQSQFVPQPVHSGFAKPLVANALATEAPFVPGELIVSIKPLFGIQAASVGALQQLAIEDIKEITPPGKSGISAFSAKSQLVHVTLLDKSENAVHDAIELLNSDDAYDFAQPNWIYTESRTPDDADYAELWALHNTGQTGGTADADMDAQEAWNVETGKSTTVIGIIDTGIDYLHPDLVANMWVNPGEIAGNGIDDDNNGFIDDIHGWDFVNEDNDPMDGRGHGTHVAGTIAAKGNDGSGVVGVMWDAQLMALKFLSDSGSGSTVDAIEAINYATMMNVPITNNSWGGGAFDPALEIAIAAGNLFVAAAGNDFKNMDQINSYPAGYDLDNILAVAASDHNDVHASFSNYGATKVDVSAPGVGIYSTIPEARYATYKGTSMASPQVAGVAGLLYSLNPSLTATEIKSLIMESVDVIPGLAGRTVTGGRVNAAAAIAASTPYWLTVTPAVGSIDANSTADITVTADASALMPGTWAAEIVFETSDPSTPEVTLPVTLEVGACKTLSFDTENLSFPLTWVGNTATETIVLFNECNEDVAVSSFSSLTPEFTTIPTTPFVVPAFSSVTREVTFAPSAETDFSSALNIQTDADNGPVFYPSLNGEGQLGPEIALSPSMVTFTIEAESADQQVITISNAGPRTLQATLSTAASWLTVPNSITVPAQGSETITIEATAPQLGGLYTTEIHFEHNGVGVTPVVYPVTMTVTAPNYLSTTISELDWGVVTQPTQPLFSTKILDNIDVGSAKVHYYDMDQDGDLDAVYGFSISDRNYQSDLVWYENSDRCDEKFVKHHIMTGEATFWEYHRMDIGDLDGDGDIDIAVVMGDRSGHSDAYLYHNDGSFNFTVTEIETDGYITDIFIRDTDNDGLNDVILSKGQEFYMEFYINDGIGGYTMRLVDVPGDDEQSSLKVIDLDSDGDLDFLSVDYDRATSQRTLTWYENSGDFALVERDIQEISHWADTEVADIDADGDLDIIIAPWDDGLRIYENDGNSNYTVTLVSSDRFSQWSKVADLDGDGLLDIITQKSPGFPNYPTLWYKNEGNLNFSEQAELGNGIFQPMVYDMDGDADIDIFAFESQSDNIIYLENQVSQTMQLVIENSGGSPTTISSVGLDNPLFIFPKQTPVVVPPLSTVCYEMSYLGEGMPYEVGAMTIVSNALDNPSITVGLKAGLQEETDIALNKTTTASSVESGLPASHATDGDATTRWSSDFSDPQWVMIDLAGAFDIHRVVLNWETAAARVYTVQVSSDGSSWTTIHTENNGNGGVDAINASATNVTHIRMHGTQRTTEWGYSLFSFEVFGIPHIQEPPVLTTIQVIPNTVILERTTTHQFTALGFDQFGNQMALTPTWSSTHDNINQAGLYTARYFGTFEVQARFNAVLGTATVVVPEVPVLTSIVINPSNASVALGQTLQFHAIGLDQNGNAMPDAFTCAWTLQGNGGIIDPNGLFTATTESTTTFVTATKEGISQSVPVTVINEPLDIALGKPATASSTEGSHTPGNTVDGNSTTRWSSDFADGEWIMIDLQGAFDLTTVKLHWETAAARQYLIQVSTDAQNWGIAASVSNGNGGFDELSTPVENIRYIRMFGQARTTEWGYSLFSFEVYGVPHIQEPPVLTSLTLTPRGETVQIGETIQYDATAFDQFNQPMAVTFSWDISGTAGTIDQNGLFTAVSEGIATVTASTGGMQVLTTVTVTDIQPVNMFTNGDFSNGLNNWKFDTYNEASASTGNAGNQFNVGIANGGTAAWNIQIQQGGIPLESGKRYRLSFDARADANRSIDAQLETDGSPWTNYGSIPSTNITPVMSNYSYEFVMSQTDMN